MSKYAEGERLMLFLRDIIGTPSACKHLANLAVVPPGHKQPNSVILCSRLSAYKHFADLMGWNQMGGSKLDQKHAKDWEQKHKSSITGIGSIARSSVNEMARPTFDVQVLRTPEHQMLSSSSSVPLTIRNESDEETNTDNLKNLMFDEYVDGDDDEETPNYNDDEINVKAEQDKQGSRLIIEEINKMKAEYSERYHKICLENKWKLPSGKFAENILYQYTLNLEYE
ncbi:3067_t:CDS:2, partial [Funneliformis geosporum]